MRLRDYQQRAMEAVLREFETRRSTLVVKPTGTGKTVFFAAVASHMANHGRVMVIAHRQELIDQAGDKIRRVTGVRPDIEMAGQYATEWGFYGKSSFVVSSVQTQVAGRDGGRMTRFDPNEFSLLVIDEAHHATAASYRRVIDYYSTNPNLKILGVTATPDRADESALGRVFESVAFDYELPEAIDDGWLVPVRQQYVMCANLDFSNIRTKAGDLDGRELSELVEQEHALHAMVSPTIEIAGGRQTAYFAASVKAAERTCEIFNRHKPGSAECVFGHTPKDRRAQVFQDFRLSRIQFLVGVGVMTEGYDEPGVEVVAIARPTKSRSLYTQMCGRGTRPLPNVVDDHDTPESRRQAIAASQKPAVLILDFIGQSGRHKLISTADILGGKYDDDIRERAKRAVQRSGGSADMTEELIKAKEAKRKAAEEAERARRARVKARAEYATRDVNPWNRGDSTGVFKRPRHWFYKPATENQVNFLARHNIDATEMTLAQASDAIENLGPTPKQRSFLKWKGIDPEGMSKSQASEAISRIKDRDGDSGDRVYRVI